MFSTRDALSLVPQLSLAATKVTNSTSTAATAALFNNDSNSSSITDSAAKIFLSLLPGTLARNNVRTLHALLVATNLFWYQAIRQTVAVMSVFMCAEFADRGMDTSQQAKLIAAPSVGNIFTQALGGSLINILPGGTKTAIAIGLAGLATGCTLLPLSIRPQSKSPLLSKAFVLLATQGALFGAMFPSHSVLLSKWLTPNERGSAMAYGEIAMSAASMGVPVVVTSIAEYTAKLSTTSPTSPIMGWRNGFYATGFACFSYLCVWVMLGRNEPDSCSYISKKELDLIHSVQTESVQATTNGKQSDKGDTATPLPWQRILLHPSILSLFLVHMLYNFVALSLNSWMPTYYNDVLQMNPKDSKVHIVLPQLAAFLVKLCVSKVALIVREVRKKQKRLSHETVNDERSMILFSRRVMSCMGFLIMAIPLWLLPMAVPSVLGSSYSPWLSTVLFSVALAGTGFHAESFRANYLDVTEKHVGLVSGVGNCLSSVSAMCSPFVVGKIIKMTRGDWSPVWKLFGLSCLIAGLLFGNFSTTIPVEEVQ